MDFEVRPLTEADTLSLVKLHYRAFEKAAGDIFFTSPPSESSYEIMARARAKVIAKPNIQSYQAVDPSTGAMLGAAIFMVEPNGVSQEKLDEESPLMDEFAPVQDERLWRGIGKRFKECYREHVGTKPAVEVLMLIVDPQVHRRGIGSALLDIGVKEADRFVRSHEDVQHMLTITRIGCLTYVDATDDGVRTYEKAGFKEVGNIGFDTSSYGINKRFPVDTVSDHV